MRRARAPSLAGGGLGRRRGARIAEEHSTSERALMPPAKAGAERGARPHATLGALVGLALGAVLGSRGVLGELWILAPAALAVSLFLLASSPKLRSAGWSVAAVTEGVAGAAWGVLALGLFFGLVFGAFFVVDRLFSLEAWGAYWKRYPVTRGVYLEGLGTAALVAIMSLVLRDRTGRGESALVANLAFGMMLGLASVAACGLVFMLLLPVIIPMELLNVSVPPGRVGGVAGGALGGAYGALLGIASWLFAEMLDSS